MEGLTGLILFMLFIGFLAVGIVWLFLRVLEEMQKENK